MAVKTPANSGIAVLVNGDTMVGRRYVRSIRWYSKSAVADDDCLVTDADGNVVMPSVADGADFLDVQIINSYVNGLAAALDSGEITVYCGFQGRVVEGEASPERG